MKKEQEEIFWKRKDGNLIFGGIPVSRTGKEFGLELRLKLLKKITLGGNVLSLGCGVAVELEPFKKQDFVTVGIDPQRNFLSEGKIGGYADNLIQAIGENIPFQDESFDLVLLFEVLEHVINPEATLNEINRILKPRGVLFITVPNRFYPLEMHGIQVRNHSTVHLLGIGLPFFSMMPNFIRKKYERARIYTQAQLISILKKNCFEPFAIKYLMPPLDIIKQDSLTNAIRKIFLTLTDIPLIHMFGANIMVLAKKTKCQSSK